MPNPTATAARWRRSVDDPGSEEEDSENEKGEKEAAAEAPAGQERGGRVQDGYTAVFFFFFSETPRL